MFLTGFADEAGADLDTQIRATLELGWRSIEARTVGDANIHDLSDAAFDRAAGRLKDAGITVAGFGSCIANWGKDIADPAEGSMAEARRAIPRMRSLGTKIIRVMSYREIKGRGIEDQMQRERFARLRELNRMFAEEGMQMAHENCATWGGMGWTFTLRLLDAVPGLKLIFDTGNPLETEDFSKPEPRPRQSAWEFYEHVRDQVVHVHIKDGVWDAAASKPVWGWPGEGQGDVRRIVADLAARGYAGGLSIEPHMAVVYHDPKAQAAAEERYANYVEYGRRTERIARELGVKL